MLIQVNETITVKLSAVCNINILKDKQVFNMCYTFTDKKGAMSGYYYVDSGNINYQNSKYFKEKFIAVRGIDRLIYINTDFVSFIKKDYTNYPKVVIGFSHSVLRHNVESFAFAPEYMYIRTKPEDLDNTYNEIIETIANISK